MRLFLGINLPDDVREHLTLVQDSLRADLTHGISWVRPEQFHITVKFLGECNESKRAAIERRIAVTKLPRLPSLQAYTTHVFPGHHLVIASQIWDFTGELTTIIHLVEEALVAEGIEREDRSKKPHVTLGRIRRLPAGIRVMIPWDDTIYPGPAFLPTDFFLFQSVLSQNSFQPGLVQEKRFFGEVGGQ